MQQSLVTQRELLVYLKGIISDLHLIHLQKFLSRWLIKWMDT